MTILVLGQNPARSSKTGEPFVGTRSGKRLLRWLEQAGVKDYTLRNLSDEKTKGNAPLKMSKIRKIATSDAFLNMIASHAKVIALGTQVRKAIFIAYEKNKSCGHVLLVPHPSGRNHYFNNPGAEEDVVERIRNYVHGDAKAP